MLRGSFGKVLATIVTTKIHHRSSFLRARRAHTLRQIQWRHIPYERGRRRPRDGVSDVIQRGRRRLEWKIDPWIDRLHSDLFCTSAGSERVQLFVDI